MKCSRCSFDNPPDVFFCSQCGQPVAAGIAYLDARLEEKIKIAIQDQFRNQDLVAAETENRVFQSLASRAKTYAWIFGLIGALLLICLGVPSYLDLWHKVRQADSLQPALDHIRTEIVDAQTAAGEAEQKADHAKTTIYAAQAEVLRAASELSARIPKASQHVTEQLADLDGKVTKAETDIGTQKKKLSDTDELVSALYSKSQSYVFNMYSGTPALPGKAAVVDGGDFYLICMLIPAPPIFQTLQIQWDVFVLPKFDSSSVRNVVMVRWKKSRGDWHAHPLYLSYVPNPAESLRFSSLDVKGDTVYGDGVRIASASDFKVPER
jgi:hypothetical protein